MPKIAYITSGKIGIHRFTYNELIELNKNKIDFILCLTQLNHGPWMPMKGWPVLVASKQYALVELAGLIITRPGQLIRLFFEAADNNVLPFFFMALSFYRFVKKEPVSSIHCQMGDKKLYIGYFLKQLMEGRVPLSVTVHAHELYQRSVYDFNRQVRELFSNCDMVFTISQFNADILIKNFGVDPDKLKIMRLFPIIDAQKRVLQKTRILIVANWAEKKGYKTLFHALKEIQRDDFIVWVVGGTYFSDNSINLEKLVLDFDVQDKVILLERQGGTVLDILFSACDIFCLPSQTEYYDDGNPAEREGIPVSLMEAMAWGKPVISTKHAGIPELVEDLLVEENNVGQLKEAIEYMLDHPEEWAQQGGKNKRMVETYYSKENIKVLSDTFKEWQRDII